MKKIKHKKVKNERKKSFCCCLYVDVVEEETTFVRNELFNLIFIFFSSYIYFCFFFSTLFEYYFLCNNKKKSKTEICNHVYMTHVNSNVCTVPRVSLLTTKWKKTKKIQYLLISLENRDLDGCTPTKLSFRNFTKQNRVKKKKNIRKRSRCVVFM